MLIRRVIATQCSPASLAGAQVHPIATGKHAFLTDISFGRLKLCYLLYMFTYVLFRHRLAIFVSDYKLLQSLFEDHKTVKILCDKENGQIILFFTIIDTED
jgi:hypothetical protein